jgi:serine/threonine protein kinase
MNNPNMSMSSVVGQQIGNYRVEKELASGGFGTVFLAQHIHLRHRTAVIKLLHALRLNSAEERAQFMQEGQILDQLRGLPHILPMLDFGVEPANQFPYMITDYAEKGSLQAYIKQRQGPVPLQEALTILSQIGLGLQAAHDRQIVHRDLKPANVLFDAQNKVLLADFGISTILTTTTVTHADVAGSPAYMAPEQFRGMVGKESDQYGLACILYELLTGARPFEASGFMAMGYLHVSAPPPSPRSRQPQIPDYIDRAILKALAKDRHERFPSVSAFIAALQALSPQVFSDPPPVPGPVPSIQAAPPAFSASMGAGDQSPAWSLTPPPPYMTNSTPFTPQYSLGSDPYASSPYNGSSAYNSTAPNPYPSSYLYGAGAAAMNQVGSIPYVPSMGQIPFVVPPEDPFLTMNRSGLRALAALSYLFSPLILFFSVPLYALGRGNRFARFHLMQGILFWLHVPVIATFFYYATGGSKPYSESSNVESAFACVAGIWFVMFVMFLFILCIATIAGKYFKIPLFGQLAERYAERGRRYSQPR